MLYISCTPIPNKELYFRPIAEPVPLHWGDTKPGVVREFKNTPLLPIVIASNKKVLRANARRHIALDCHSRTPTFPTLIVLLRNDRGESMPGTQPPECPPPLAGGVALSATGGGVQ